jgi:hypothetical protein
MKECKRPGIFEKCLTGWQRLRFPNNLSTHFFRRFSFNTQNELLRFGWYSLCFTTAKHSDMETDKQVVNHPSNSVSRELFVEMQQEETLSEKLMEMNLDEEDEEPVDNTQI